MKYKVGDKVKIRDDLNDTEEYWMEDGTSSNCANDDMLRLKSKVCTIRSVDGEQYILEGSSWHWVDGMFEDEKKYKRGDKVQIRKDLIPWISYGTECFTPEMEAFKDRTCTINYLTIRKSGTKCYKIMEDNGKWGWTDEMFEPKTAMEVEKRNQRLRTRMEALYRNVTYGAFGGQRFGKQKELDTLKQLFKDGENWQEWKTGVRLFYRWHETPIADLKTDRIHNILSIVHDVRQPCSYFGLPRETWIVCLEKELQYREWKNSVNAIYGKKENKENKEDIKMSNTDLIEHKLKEELEALDKAEEKETKDKFYETPIGKAAKAFNEALEKYGNEDQKDCDIDEDQLMELSEDPSDIRAEYEAKRQEVKEYYAEAITLFESADTYEQKHEILTAYGILKGPKAAKAKVEAK